MESSRTERAPMALYSGKAGLRLTRLLPVGYSCANRVRDQWRPCPGRAGTGIWHRGLSRRSVDHAKRLHPGGGHRVRQQKGGARALPKRARHRAHRCSAGPVLFRMNAAVYALVGAAATRRRSHRNMNGAVGSGQRSMHAAPVGTSGELGGRLVAAAVKQSRFRTGDGYPEGRG